MNAQKIILTAFLLFLTCTAAAGKSAPDISVTVVTEDDRGNRQGVPAVAVAVTDDKGIIKAQALTDGHGTALFVKTAMQSGQQIRILIRGALPDGTAIFQGGADKEGRCLLYTPGMQQNFVLTRSGRIWPDYLQWDQDASDNTTPPAYVATAPAVPDKRTRPDTAPYMGAEGKINPPIHGSQSMQSIQPQPPAAATPQKFLPPEAAPAVSTALTTAQPNKPAVPPPLLEADVKKEGANNSPGPALFVLLIIAAVLLGMLFKRNKR